MAESKVSPKSAEAGYELSDLPPKGIALFALILAVTVLIVGFLTYGIARHFRAGAVSRQLPASPHAQRREPAPAPHLWVNPAQEFKAMRAEDDLVLNSYGWVDKQKGIARIPIEQAMELLAQQAAKQKATGSRQESEGKE
jgi:hypothetical protein